MRPSATAAAQRHSLDEIKRIGQFECAFCLAGIDAGLLLEIAQLVANIGNECVFVVGFDLGACSGFKRFCGRKFVSVWTRNEFCPSLVAGAIENSTVSLVADCRAGW